MSSVIVQSLVQSNTPRSCPSGYYSTFSTLTMLVDGVNQTLIVQSCGNNPSTIQEIDSRNLGVALGVGIPVGLLLLVSLSMLFVRCCRLRNSIYGNYPKGLKDSALAVPLKSDNQITFEALGPIHHRQFLAGNLTADLMNKLNNMSTQELESAYWTATQHSREQIALHINSILKARGAGGLHASFEVKPYASAPKHI